MSNGCSRVSYSTSYPTEFRACFSILSRCIFLGRNQCLYDFWFYITVFARYPRSIYDRSDPNRFEAGEMLQFGLSYLMPILLVITVPARVMVNTLTEKHWAAVAVAAAVVGMIIARLVFRWSLGHYRSASS